jgi:hypothetical protein
VLLGVVAALWSVLLGLVVVAAEVEEALWSAVVLVAAAPIVPVAPVLEAWLLVQESEIMFTELTCREPSLARVPWTCTWCPSWGFRTELSPCRFTVWPLSAERTQLPPDCFRQPLSEPDWSLPVVALVALEFWPWVLPTLPPVGALDGSLPCFPRSCPCPCAAAPLLEPAVPCAPP